MFLFTHKGLQSNFYLIICLFLLKTPYLILCMQEFCAPGFPYFMCFVVFDYYGLKHEQLNTVKRDVSELSFTNSRA